MLHGGRGAGGRAGEHKTGRPRARTCLGPAQCVWTPASGLRATMDVDLRLPAALVPAAPAPDGGPQLGEGEEGVAAFAGVTLALADAPLGKGTLHVTTR